MKIYKYITLCLIIILNSCANSDDYKNIDISYQKATVTKALEDIYAIAEPFAVEYINDDVIEAYVTSSDEGGVFYKSMSFQNLEGTLGFSLAVDGYNLYSEIEPGRKVYIRLKGLYYMTKHGSLVLGDLFEENDVGRITLNKFRNSVLISEKKVDENALIHVRTIEELKQEKFINTLVEIQDVQFEKDAIGKTYYDASNSFGGATSYKIEQTINDVTEKIVFRTNKYARFASKKVSKNKGSVRGVLTKYNTTYQFSIRTDKDLNLDKDRSQYVTTYIGGENMQFLTTLSEDFSSFVVGENQTAFEQYGNDYFKGGRYWAVKEYSNNKYIQLSAYGNMADETTSYFIMPVFFSGNSTLSFKTKDGYYNGDVLNIYYTDAVNYSYGDLIVTDEFVNITSQFTIASGTTSGYANSFTASGTYHFSSEEAGEGYVIFEYKGNASKTTTMQIDDVVFN